MACVVRPGPISPELQPLQSANFPAENTTSMFSPPHGESNKSLTNARSRFSHYHQLLALLSLSLSFGSPPPPPPHYSASFFPLQLSFVHVWVGASRRRITPPSSPYTPLFPASLRLPLPRSTSFSAFPLGTHSSMLAPDPTRRRTARISDPCRLLLLLSCPHLSLVAIYL